MSSNVQPAARTRVKNVSLLAIVLPALFFFHASLFAFLFALEAPRADAFRHITLYLQPLSDGSFTITNLWANHHPKPVHAIFYILNSSLLSLDYRLETLVGTLSLGLIGFLICREYAATAPTSNKPRQFWILYQVLGLTAICLVVFTLNAKIHLTWTLVTFGFFEVAMGVLAYYEYSRITSNRTEGTTGFFAVVAVLIIANFDRAVVLLAPLILLTIWLSITGHQRRTQLQLVLGLVILLILGKALIAWLAPVGNKAGSTFSALVDLVQDPRRFLSFVASGLMASFMDPRDVVALKTNRPDLFLTAQSLTVAVYGGATIGAMHRRCWTHSAMPLLLALLPLCFMGAVFLSRQNALEIIPNLSTSPRYLLNYHLGWAGVAWLFARELLLTRHHFPAALAGMALLVLVYSHASLAVSNWALAKRYTASATQEILNILTYSDGMGSELKKKQCPVSGQYCDRVLAFLKENQLSLFSPRYSNRFQKGCDARLLSWRHNKNNGVTVLEFDRDMARLPLDIRVNGNRINRVHSSKKIKRIKSKLDRNAENLIEVFCFDGGRFVKSEQILLPALS